MTGRIFRELLLRGRERAFLVLPRCCLLVLATFGVLFAVPPAVLAAPSGTTHAFPAHGSAGVTQLCGPDPAYSCTTGGYAGQSTGWWGPKYGAGQASSNAFGYHNCTLYAAYRIAQDGVTDPGWSQNADAWATSAYAHGTPVDQTPAVGAIAQWNGGSLGHVAYVEVVTSSYIEVTDDNYGWNRTNRWRIAAGSPAWPDNFIHFKAQVSSLGANKHLAGLPAATYGKTIALSGRESLGGPITVVLEADSFPFKRGFAAVTHVVTSGAYSFDVSPQIATKYRVILPDGTASPILPVYVIPRTVSSSCNLCNYRNAPGEHTLVVSATWEPMNGTGPMYFYYGQDNGSTAPPKTLRMVKTVHVQTTGSSENEFTVRYHVYFPATAFHFLQLACRKDAEQDDGLGLPGDHHCGDATIPSNVDYLG